MKSSRLIRTIGVPVEVVKEYRRAYLFLNIIYYGLMVAAMLYAASNPALQRTLLDEIGRAFGSGPLEVVGGAYKGGQVLLAAVLTFVVNLVVGSFVLITLPSLIVPFSGLMVGVYRALLWGLLFSPTAVNGPEVIFLWPTPLLEGQGYALAMLAAYAQGMAFLRPKTLGKETRTQGYREGVMCSARIYVLVTTVLPVAAIHEAVSVIFIMQGAAR